MTRIAPLPASRAPSPHAWEEEANRKLYPVLLWHRPFASEGRGPRQRESRQNRWPYLMLNV
jgi:hypothetical protein